MTTERFMIVRETEKMDQCVATGFNSETEMREFMDRFSPEFRETMGEVFFMTTTGRIGQF